MRLDKVGKRYGIRLPWVVRDVSLDIPPGGLVRFEGKNGSGKSTLLRVIAGASEPSRGKVTGRPVAGYVPERFPAALPFPAREYLAHIGRVHGLAGPDLESRIDACLDRLGGRELAPVPLRTMSKGMAQKVAVAQALLPRSGLLVLDEAWTGLDVEAKAALDEAIAERIAAGGSVVFVDHEPGRLAHLDADRWLLQDGHAVRVRADDRAAGAAPGAAAGRPATDERGGVASAEGIAGGGEAGPSGAGTGEAGPGGASPGGAGPGRAGPGAAVVIVVSGYPAEPGESAEQGDPAGPPGDGRRSGQALLAGVPGVLSARREGERLIVAAEPDYSDAVLRWLLGSGNGAHVLRVGQADVGRPEVSAGEVGGSGSGRDEPEGGR